VGGRQDNLLSANEGLGFLQSDVAEEAIYFLHHRSERPDLNWLPGRLVEG